MHSLLYSESQKLLNYSKKKCDLDVHDQLSRICDIELRNTPAGHDQYYFHTRFNGTVLF